MASRTGGAPGDVARAVPDRLHLVGRPPRPAHDRGTLRRDRHTTTTQWPWIIAGVLGVIVFVMATALVAENASRDEGSVVAVDPAS